LCINNIPGTAAQAIDAKLDDGEKTSGSMQSISGGEDGATAYSDASTYTLCTRM
jgi:hypothetical protein